MSELNIEEVLSEAYSEDLIQVNHDNEIQNRKEIDSQIDYKGDNKNEEERIIDNLIEKYTENDSEKEDKIKAFNKSNIVNKKLNKELRKKFEDNIQKYFLNSEKEKNNTEEENNNSTEEIDIKNLFGYSKLKKLKKKSEMEKEKKINKKVSMSFFDIEAELGSDNEEHDDMVKLVKDSDEEDEGNLDQDLKDLIAEDENLYEDRDTLQQKYFDDMLDKDREEVRRVINGPERLPQLKIKRNRPPEDDNIDDLPLQIRMKKYLNNEEQEQDPQFDMKALFNKVKSIQEKLAEGAEEENEEMTEIYQSLHDKMIKKLSDKQKSHRTVLFNRMKENDKILENVINLNQSKSQNDYGKDSNKFFIKGVNTGQNINNSSPSLKDVNKTPILTAHQSTVPKKFGAFYNHKNSFLHAMKNDKYYIKTSNSLHDNNDMNSLGKTSSNNDQKSENTNMNSTTGTNVNNYSIFNNSSNTSSNMNKSSNLSALFTQSNKNRHKETSAISRQSRNNHTPIKDNSSSLKKLLNS